MRNHSYPYYDIPQVTTLRELIECGRANGGNRTVLYLPDRDGGEEEVTFNMAYRYVEAMGTFLYSRGLRGSRIAILGENSAEWTMTYFAVTNSGNTVVPLDRMLPAEDLADMLRDCGCDTLFYSDTYADYVEHFMAQEGFPVKNYFRLGDFRRFVAGGWLIRESGDTEFADCAVTPEQLACIVYTSGTSGKSKGVMLSHGNLAADVVATCQCVAAGNTVIVLPLNHSFSWASSMFAAYLYIEDAYICRNLKHMIKDFRRAAPQNISAVPLMVELIYKNIWDTARKKGVEKKLRRAVALSRTLMACGIDLRKRLFRDVRAALGGNLELIICGGAALDAELQSGLYDLGINVINGYGITECSPVVAVNRNCYFRFGSVGQPLPCNRVMINEPDESGVGEIYVSGSNVMMGYYNDPEATAEAFDGEWFKTGDYGRLDSDGFLYITGRKKNLIILSNGKNISPEELEGKLGRLEYVREVAVYEDGGRITAEFYLDEETWPDAEERLREDVAQFNRDMPSYKNIGAVRTRREPFVKTTTMKIKRHQLQNGRPDADNTEKEKAAHEVNV